MRLTKPFALCVDNRAYKVSLILGKVYRVLPDKKAAKDDLVRIVDETGEDYLFPKDHFVFVDFPKAVTSKIMALSIAKKCLLASDRKHGRAALACRSSRS